MAAHFNCPLCGVVPELFQIGEAEFGARCRRATAYLGTCMMEYAFSDTEAATWAAWDDKTVHIAGLSSKTRIKSA